MSFAAGSAFDRDQHRVWAGEIIKLIGLDPNNKKAVSRVLKSMPAEELNNRALKFFYDIAPDAFPGRLQTSPVVDGEFLPSNPIKAFQAGEANPVPLMMGTTSREGALLDKALPVIASKPDRLEALFRETDWTVRERIIKVYPHYPSKRGAIDVSGDLTFWQPSVLIAEAHARLAPCWSYRFDYATLMTRLLFREATHGLDLPMLFGTVGQGALGMFYLFSKRTSNMVSDRFRTAFMNFVRKSDPGWSMYDADSRKTYIFDRENREESDPRRDRRVAWGEFIVN